MTLVAVDTAQIRAPQGLAATYVCNVCESQEILARAACTYSRAAPCRKRFGTKVACTRENAPRKYIAPFVDDAIAQLAVIYRAANGVI